MANTAIFLKPIAFCQAKFIPIRMIREIPVQLHVKKVALEGRLIYNPGMVTAMGLLRIIPDNFSLITNTMVMS